jgi:hypothetical protein
MRIISVILLLLFFTSCEQKFKEEIPNVSDIQMDVKIVRLDKEMRKLETVEQVEQFLNQYSQVADEFFMRKKYPQSKVLAERMLGFIQHPATDTLMRDIDQVFGDFEKHRKEFEQAFQFIKYYYPEFQTPTIYTIASGFVGDIFIGEGFIVIGLDYMAGEKATYRPPSLPQYILKRCQPEYIVPNTMILMANRYVQYDAKDKTMIADMIFYGKALHFAHKTTPFLSDTLILGYTSQELADCYSNEEKVWKYFVQEQLFFETAFDKKRKFVEESPKVYEIGNNCPGRIGRWLGLQIIRSFEAKNSGISLDSLLKIRDAKYIFEESKYKPKN